MTKIQANHRALLKGAVLLFLSSLFTIQSSIAQAKEQPNIILIMADDLGYECIGANGGTSYQTPVLDGLAKTGMRFEHCYSQPLCTPSRVQIMTGIYNVRNYTKFGELDRKQTTFAHLLKQATPPVLQASGNSGRTRMPPSTLASINPAFGSTPAVVDRWKTV